MPRLLERLHTLWTALRLRLRGGAPGVFYIGGSDTMPAPLDREAEQDGTPGPANPLSDAPTMAGRAAADKGTSAQDGDGQKGGEDR